MTPPKEHLAVTIVQSDLHWENAEANRKHFQGLLQLVTETDLILLPEMFTTGFSMHTKEFAEKMDGETVHWMKKLSAEKKAVVMGSVMIEDNGNFFNRLIVAHTNGELQHYDKRHLFAMGNEHEHYSAGKNKINVRIHGWNICPLVCYDLRFPVWARNTNPRYDVLLYVANWPDVRRHAWKSLLTARAIENQSYVCGVNRIGTDTREIVHAGDSCVIDPKGVWISKTVPYKQNVETVYLSYPDLAEYREKFPVLNDADEFSII